MVALAAAFFAASASAFPNYVRGSFFGSVGAGNGQFEEPLSVATDSAGNLWVVDGKRETLQKFNSKGEFLSKIENNYVTLEYPTDVAIDSTGNLWVVDFQTSSVHELNSIGQNLVGFGGYGTANGYLREPRGIAIDSKGDLWVTDTGNNRVEEFNSAGEYLRQFGTKGSGAGQLNRPEGIAIDSAGHVWVMDTENARLEEFSAEGAYMATVAEGQLIAAYGDTLAIDPAGNLWVVESHYNRVKALNAKGELLTEFGDSEGTFSGALVGVAFDPSGNPWIVNRDNSRIQKWVPEAPAATTKAVTEIKTTGATLNAMVNPEGSSTTYQFEYGTTTSYGSKVPLSPASVGSGTNNVMVSQALSGLKAGTTYHFRVSATNAGGTGVGVDKTFRAEALPGTWTIAGTAFSGSESIEIKGSGATFSAPGLGITLGCSNTASKGAGISEGTKSSAEALTLTGCAVTGNETKCQVHSEGQAVGTILTGALKSELKTIGSHSYDVFAPQGSIFAQIVIEKKTGQTCLLSGTYEWSGQFAAETGGTEEVEYPLSFSEAIAKEVNAARVEEGQPQISLKFGGKSLQLGGTFKQKLTGSRAGKKWRVTP